MAVDRSPMNGANLDPKVREILEKMCDAIDASIAVPQSEVDASEVKASYTLARAAGTHALATTLTLADLAGDATQAAANARANALKTALVAHLASVGTVSAAGAHLAADTGNGATLSAIPDASGLASCITIVNGLLAALTAHGDQAGVHFHNDAAAAAATITTDPPVTLDDCITDLNDLSAAIATHLALGEDTQ